MQSPSKRRKTTAIKKNAENGEEELDGGDDKVAENVDDKAFENEDNKNVSDESSGVL